MPCLPSSQSLPSCRITPAGLTFDPMCPAGVSGMCVSGVSYQGSKLDFSFSEGSVTVEVRPPAGPGGPPLEVELWPSQTRLPLRPGRLLPRDPPRGPPAGPACALTLRVAPCPCRTQGLLSPLCWPDTKVTLVGAEAASSAPRMSWEKLLETREPTAPPGHLWAPQPGAPHLVPSWL